MSYRHPSITSIVQVAQQPRRSTASRPTSTRTRLSSRTAPAHHVPKTSFAITAPQPRTPVAHVHSRVIWSPRPSSRATLFVSSHGRDTTYLEPQTTSCRSNTYTMRTPPSYHAITLISPPIITPTRPTNVLHQWTTASAFQRTPFTLNTHPHHRALLSTSTVCRYPTSRRRTSRIMQKFLRVLMLPSSELPPLFSPTTLSRVLAVSWERTRKTRFAEEGERVLMRPTC